ncbi:MAG: RNA polymerase sigma factor [Hyphomicrobiales bacterium]
MLEYTEKELIEGCLSNNRKCQHAFYSKFSMKMYGVCLRYAKDEDEAKDILQEAFIKIFKSLQDFKGNGSLEGWVRRTIINTSINYYRKNLKFSNNVDLEYAESYESHTDDALSEITTKEVQEVISDLPDGYRMVFNLNAVEGYTHKEIGEMLDISENTSKSQLSRARNVLKNRMEELYAI